MMVLLIQKTHRELKDNIRTSFGGHSANSCGRVKQQTVNKKR